MLDFFTPVRYSYYVVGEMKGLQMFKPGQKVNHKTQNLNGVVVARAPRFGKTWCAVLWTLPNGRREQRVEHYTNLK